MSIQPFQPRAWAPLYDPNYVPSKITTRYSLGDERAFTKIQGSGGQPTKYIAYRNAGFLSKTSGAIVLSWTWPARIPAHFTGQQRETIATEIAMWYGR